MRHVHNLPRLHRPARPDVPVRDSEGTDLDDDAVDTPLSRLRRASGSLPDRVSTKWMSSGSRRACLSAVSSALLTGRAPSAPPEGRAWIRFAIVHAAILIPPSLRNARAVSDLSDTSTIATATGVFLESVSVLARGPWVVYIHVHFYLD